MTITADAVEAPTDAPVAADLPTHPSDLADTQTATPITTPIAAAVEPSAAPSPPRPDEELLALLEREIAGTGTRPSRRDVMTVTGVGTDRATRLLTTLDSRHQWPAPAAPKKRGSTARTGASRSQTRPAPALAPVTEPAAPHDPAPSDTTVAVSTASTAPALPVPLGPVSLGPVPVTDPHAGRLVAWVAFVFGSVMSIAANVLHTWLPAAHEPAGWNPGLAPQIGAAVWPIGLLLSVEVLSRVRWHKGWAWFLARYVGAGTVALGSAVISYGHLRDVLTAWSYGHPGADVGPLVLDGLMVISGFALLAISRPPAPTGTTPPDHRR